MADDIYKELNVDERRNKILELLTQEGKVKVAELSKIFSISEVTIRNDLSELESSGLLERMHGGAVSTYKAYYKMSLHDRMKTNEPEKRRVATTVGGLINDGDTVMINSGTTTLFVIQELKNVKRELTIVTNSITIAQEVGHYKSFQVILLGGNLNPQYQFTFGDDTINQLKRYKADKLILAVDGVSAADGLTTYHHFEAEVNRQMIARVNQTIVAADYSKLGRTSFSFVAGIESIDYLITNTNINQEELQAMKEKAIEIVMV